MAGISPTVQAAGHFLFINHPSAINVTDEMERGGGY
jgi:hypothetical protein